MRILIAEDDLASRKFMQKFLSRYGECDIAVNGMEMVDAFLTAIKDNKPYDLVCIDIMMPKLDGVKALKAIRKIESQENISDDKKAKVIMTTALNDKDTVTSSYDAGCEAFAWKPIDIEKFVEVMKKLELIKEQPK